MKRQTVQHQILEAVLALEDSVKITPLAFYLMSALVFLQRLHFSVDESHRWLYKFPPLVQLGKITHYAGLYIALEDSFAINLATIVALGALYLTVALKVALKVQNKLCLVVLGWSIRVSELLFIPLLNLNLYSLNQHGSLRVLAILAIALYYTSVFLVTGNLHRVVESAPVAILYLNPDLVYAGTFAALGATAFRAYLHDEPQRFLYFLIAEGWVAVWTLCQVGMPVDLNGSELLLFFLTLVLMLGCLCIVHLRQGKIRPHTVVLATYRELIILERNKNYQQFRHRMAAILMCHQRDCGAPQCRCRQVVGQEEDLHQRQVDFLYSLIEKVSEENPESLMALQLLADISLCKENFKMGGLLVLIKRRNESSSLIFQMRLQRLIRRFEELLLGVDASSLFCAAKVIQNGRIVEQMQRTIEEGIAQIIEFWNIIASPHPNLIVISEASHRYLQLVDLTRKCLPIIGAGSVRFNYWVNSVIHDHICKARLRAFHNFDFQHCERDGLFVISLQDSDFGEIENVSLQVLQLTGYDKNYLLNCRVNELLPSCLCDWHEAAMKQDELCYKPILGPKFASKFLVNNEGYLTPFSFKYKILPFVTRGVSACVVTREDPLPRDSLMVLFDEQGRIRGFSSLAKQFFVSRQDMTRKLSYLNVKEVIRDPELKPNLESPVYTEFTRGKFEEQSGSSKVELVEIVATRNIKAFFDEFTLLTISFETLPRQPDSDNLQTVSLWPSEHAPSSYDPREYSNGHEQVKSIYQFTLLYVILLTINKAAHIAVGVFSFFQINDVINALSAFTRQTCEYLSLKSYLALSALGVVGFDPAALKQALSNYSNYHEAAQSYGWTSSQLVYSSITASQSPIQDVLIETLYLFEKAIDDGPQYLFGPGTTSALLNESVWGTSEVAVGLQRSGREVGEQGWQSFCELQNLKFVLACLQIGLLLLFLGLKVFPILNINRVVGCNFSQLRRVDIPRLVEFIKVLKRFEENLNSENEDQRHREIKHSLEAEEHQDNDSQYEEMLLDAQERSLNYQTLRQEFDWNDFVRLPLVKLLAIFVFLADIFVAQSNAGQTGQLVGVQQIMLRKWGNISIYEDRYLNSIFSNDPLAGSLHSDLTLLWQAEEVQMALLSGSFKSYYSSVLDSADLCQPQYKSVHNLTRAECALLSGGILKSGEVISVISLSKKLRLETEPTIQTFRLVLYLQAYYSELSRTLGEQLADEVWSLWTAEIGLYVGFVAMMGVYTALVLLTIGRLRALIEVSQRLLTTLPEFIMKQKQ